MAKLEKVKSEEKGKAADVPSKVESFSIYKGHPMIRFSGNFMGGGFSLSKNKVKAVLENIEEAKLFAEGKYDEQIKELGEGEILRIS